MKKKYSLIFYPELNMHEATRSGGIEHLVANIQGYNSNGYKCVICCAYYPSILEKDENDNIYINYIFFPHRILSTANIHNNNNSTRENRILKYLKILFIKIVRTTYSIIAMLIILKYRPSIVHERSSQKYSILRYSKLLFRNTIRYIYEINDYLYSYKSFSVSDINLVVDKKYYPNGYKYYSRPWPVVVQKRDAAVKNNRSKKLVYIGSGMEWHQLGVMFETTKYLNKYDSKWQLDIYGPELLNGMIRDMPFVHYKGYVSTYDIDKVLCQYKYGYALYGQHFGSRRNMIGSPMKVIKYLLNGVIPITNMVNDTYLIEKCANYILVVDLIDTTPLYELIIRYESLTQNIIPNYKQIALHYSPAAYYSKLINTLK